LHKFSSVSEEVKNGSNLAQTDLNNVFFNNFEKSLQTDAADNFVRRFFVFISGRGLTRGEIS
jgi:hypothetical protein